MSCATFRFYAGLNDFLPVEARHAEVWYTFTGRPAVKDAIEALGVPHPEVALLLANGTPVDFGHPLCDEDRIAVFPHFFLLSAANTLQPALPVPPAFLLDVHLRRLARYLRMLGFDAAYDPFAGDDALARQAHAEGRVLLTRDRGLLKRSLVVHGYFVRARHPGGQLREVVDRFALRDWMAPFTRCLDCNTRLRPVEKDAVSGRLPERVRDVFDAFMRCPSCDRVYWKGSHYERMQHLVAACRRGEAMRRRDDGGTPA